MTGVQGPGTRPHRAFVSRAVMPAEHNITARTVTPEHGAPFLDRAIPGGQGGRSEVAPAGLVARVSSGQVLPSPVGSRR